MALYSHGEIEILGRKSFVTLCLEYISHLESSLRYLGHGIEKGR